MSQTILSIDASRSPALAAVVRLEADGVTLLEKQHFDLPEITALNGGGPSAESNGHTAAEPSLAAILADFKNTWTESVLIVAPRDYFSLNLDLPFSDERSIGRVINLEVQDLLPFDISEFLLQHRPIGRRANNAHDVHVSIIPRTYLQAILAACRSAGIEPLLFSPPTSALEALYRLVPAGQLDPDACLVLVENGYCYLAMMHAGRLHADRVIDLQTLGDGAQDARSLEEILVNQINLSLEAFARRLGPRTQKIYCIGSMPNCAMITQKTGIAAQALDLSELLGSSGQDGVLASLGAMFASDTRPYPPLTDFRVREFAYRPPLGELKRGLKKVGPYLLGAVLVTALAAAAVYYARERHITQIQNSMHAQIAKVAPQLTLQSGNELQTIENETAAIDQELKSLGSPSHINPLIVLRELSKYMPKGAEIKVTQLNIKGNIARIGGQVSDYSSVDRIDNALKKRKRIFCSVNKKQEGAAGYYSAATAKPFSFDLTLCE